MSLDFIILPAAPEYESDAYDVHNRIRSATSKLYDIEVDTDYVSSLYTRVTNHRKKDKDVVVIDNDNTEHNQLTIRFFEKGFAQQLMSLEELIDYVICLDNASDVVSVSKPEPTPSSQPSKCVVM